MFSLHSKLVPLQHNGDVLFANKDELAKHEDHDKLSQTKQIHITLLIIL